MVRGGLIVGDGQERAQAGPQRAGELRTCDTAGNAESLNPSLEESGCAVGGGGGRERDGLRPSSGPVDDCEKVGKTGGTRERAYQINVEV